MSQPLDLATQAFAGAEGQFSSAYNHTLSTKSLDWGTMVPLLAGLQRQAQGLIQLARALSELEAKGNMPRR